MEKPFGEPPADTIEYISQLGQLFWRDWDWHSGPAKVRKGTLSITLADYSVDLAKRIQRWLLLNVGYARASQFDDKVALSDFSYAAFENLIPFLAKKVHLATAVKDIREYLKTVLERQEVIFTQCHPQYNNPKAIRLGDVGKLRPEYEQYSEMKGMVTPKKYMEFAQWLQESPTRIEEVLHDSQPALLCPPKEAVSEFLLGFRKHIVKLIKESSLENSRDEIIEKVINQWELRAPKGLMGSTAHLAKKLGVQNIFDVEDLRPTIVTLKKLAPYADLSGYIEQLSSRIILKLSGEEQDELNTTMLIDVGDFWREHLRENDEPLYEHPDFGLAQLAGILRLNTEDDAIKYLGIVD